MEELRVRRIRDDEASLLRAVRLRALADAPEAFGQTVAEAASRGDDEWRQQARQSAAGDRRAWFLAEAASPEAGPRVVGVVNGRRRPLEDLLVFSMWVDPALRRLGIGRHLIDAIDAWGHAWGARRTVLWVFAANESAIRFYRRLGFEVEADGPDAEIGRSYGALAMSRATSLGSDADARLDAVLVGRSVPDAAAATGRVATRDGRSAPDAAAAPGRDATRDGRSAPDEAAAPG